MRGSMFPPSDSLFTNHIKLPAMILVTLLQQGDHNVFPRPLVLLVLIVPRAADLYYPSHL